MRVEIKPRFNKPQDMHLIKVTTPFERLDLDFKGPLPSQVKNKYGTYELSQMHTLVSLLFMHAQI